MAGRLAIDFGTSNTVVAAWDEARGEGVPVHVPEYGKRLRYRHGGDEESISLIPSLIHYAESGERWVGAQVARHAFTESPRTFRWMKRYVCRRSPIRVRLEERNISHFDAARDFLTAVVGAAESDLHGQEVALTVPVEAYEHYEDWLLQVAEAAGVRRARLIDEPSAAALGYGVPIQPGDVYLTFDFGGGTLDVAVVFMEEAETLVGRRCRVIGKAGADIGGATIDGWLYQEVLRRSRRGEGDDAVRQISRQLLARCEEAKESLSFQDRATIAVNADDGKELLHAEVTRDDLEDLFDRHDGHRQIDVTIRRALEAAQERGFPEDRIKAVLLVGGSSLIPSVQKLVQRVFGRERVRLRRPLDAVARGAAAFAAGVDFFDHIQHDYAVRHVSEDRAGYEYRVIVRRGTAYPTREPVARLTVRASYDGQAQLGLALFELGERFKSAPAAVELVFDPQGAARVRPVSPEDEERRYTFWVNEHRPTFLDAEPPARRGESRFEVEFGIDANKRLLVTARDLKGNRLVLRDHPVIKLT